MVQSSQSAPGQITDAIRRAHPRSRSEHPPAATSPAAIDHGHGGERPEENAALKELLTPGPPRHADGSEWQD